MEPDIKHWAVISHTQVELSSTVSHQLACSLIVHNFRFVYFFVLFCSSLRIFSAALEPLNCAIFQFREDCEWKLSINQVQMYGWQLKCHWVFLFVSLLLNTQSLTHSIHWKYFLNNSFIKKELPKFWKQFP